MKKLLIPALIAILLLAGCDEKTLQYNSVYIPTSEAETVDAADTTDTSAQETTPPRELGPCFLKEQTYYNDQGVQLAQMTVTLNEDGMPETVFLDSGTDVTHTIYYDDQGTITGSQQLRVLYDEKDIQNSYYNEHGDRTQIVVNPDGENPIVQDTVYQYDDQGRIIEKKQTQNNALINLEQTKYDEHGNIASFYNQKTTSSSTNTYIYTYENGLMVKSERYTETTNSERITDEVITYTYDEKGNLTKKKINNAEIHTYSYRNDGTLSKLVITKGSYTNYCEYNELGQIIAQYNYSDSTMTSKIVYVWEEFSVQPTDAQLKVFDLLGIV